MSKSDILNIRFNRRTFDIEGISEDDGCGCKSNDIDCNQPIVVETHKQGESVKRIGTITVFDGSRICFVFNGKVICTDI